MRVLLKDLEALAEEAAGRLSPRKERAFLAYLEGELGAGKTTFVQCLARALGAVEAVQSPTYVLMKKYQLHCRGFTSLVHIDAYRFENLRQFKVLRPESFLSDSRAIVCVEWPERITGALPEPDLMVQFLHPEGKTGARDITILFNES